jgi:hypothetical protein
VFFLQRNTKESDGMYPMHALSSSEASIGDLACPVKKIRQMTIVVTILE